MRPDAQGVAGQLVEEARQLLSEELDGWPPVSSPLLWARLQNCSARRPSGGAQVHYIRAARELGEERVARELFVLLLQQIETACAAWAAGCIARTSSISGAEGLELQEELRQELALRLWDQIALRNAPGWELFFRQSLAFAERHTATALLQQRGYWPLAGAARPERVAERLLVHLGTGGDDITERLDRTVRRLPANGGADPFAEAELADLRRLVQRLPGRLRTAIVLRHWRDASESEIARVLGGVTTRTVRNYLRQSYTLLRGWYVGEESEVQTLT